MKRSVPAVCLLFVCTLGLLVVPRGAAAQVARFEYIAFPSVTMKTSDFLTGKKEGTPVMLAGILRLPRAAGTKMPAVILLHGSGGPGGNGSAPDEWSREFNAMGIATFAIDAFSGRGLVSTVADQDSFPNVNYIGDAYRALEALANHRLIDPTRIAVMGFSLGARAAVFSGMKRFQQMHGPRNGVEFAAYIGMYTPCNTAYRDVEKLADKPFRLFHGLADDYVLAGPCRELVDRLAKAGRDIQLTTYEGAHHNFDSLTPREITASTGKTTRNCRIAEDDKGVLINAATKASFTMKDPCVEFGPHFGYNEAATAKAKVAIREFLTEVFKLK